MCCIAVALGQRRERGMCVATVRQLLIVAKKLAANEQSYMLKWPNTK